MADIAPRAYRIGEAFAGTLHADLVNGALEIDLVASAACPCAEFGLLGACPTLAVDDSPRMVRAFIGAITAATAPDE